MFSGIIETTTRVLSATGDDQLVRIVVTRPSSFQDIKIGDSIATNGVCLTLESFDSEQMQFALGPETLAITGWSVSSVLNMVLNLERSLRLNDRIHGHLVMGHVDALGKVCALESQGEALKVTIEYPSILVPLIWTKGSVALNGVSLTVNGVTDRTLQVGLIPETLKQTNLSNLKVGDSIMIEVDNLARGLLWASQVSENRIGKRQ